jgi:hypothetical protein
LFLQSLIAKKAICKNKENLKEAEPSRQFIREPSKKLRLFLPGN